jgi:exodeoxyribonuclease V alpha subunit
MITLTPQQQAAVELIQTSRVSVLTGPAGSGKSTVMRTVCDAFAAQSCNMLLAAPTGKAARRLTETTKRQAQTLHRTLGHDGSCFTYDSINQLPADVLMIDESSMLDIMLARSTLDAVRSDARVVLIGDANQLPPVGPGAFFRDLIASKKIPVAELTEVHRAAAKSWVYRNAPKLLRNQPMDLEDCEDFEWYITPDKEAGAIVPTVAGIVSKLLESGKTLDQIQVLAPMKDIEGGVVELNIAIKAEVNCARGPSVKAFDNIFYIGDRVIQTKNDYSPAINTMNGEIGTIKDIYDGRAFVEFENVFGGIDQRVFTGAALNNLLLAYAITIHKFQGSQTDTVIVVCHSSQRRMLTRQLLYTAITRAQTKVILVGDEAGLAIACKTVHDQNRRTLLKERIQEAFV